MIISKVRFIDNTPIEIQNEILNIMNWHDFEWEWILTNETEAAKYDLDIRLLRQGEYGYIIQTDAKFSPSVKFFINIVERYYRRILVESEVELDPPDVVDIWMKIDTSNTEGDEAWLNMDHGTDETVLFEYSWFGSEEGIGEGWCGVRISVLEDNVEKVTEHYKMQKRVLEVEIDE